MFFQANLIVGILLISRKKHLTWFFMILLILESIIFGTSLLEDTNQDVLDFLRVGIFFLFHITVTLEVIKQVWLAELVNKNVIFGLISGYISLGLIGFFICLSIEMVHPNSFQGLPSVETHPDAWTETLMYYSYITLLTIGYGDISPVSALAHKAAILIGLIGQFYLVVITAVVVEKYIRHSNDGAE